MMKKQFVKTWWFKTLFFINFLIILEWNSTVQYCADVWLKNAYRKNSKTTLYTLCKNSSDKIIPT